MATPNDATHFCSHPNGKLTTMICVDDLPADVVIEGAPRAITPAETQGMTSCGVVTPRSEPWKVKAPSATTSSDLSDAPFEKVYAILTELVNDINVPVSYRTAVKNLLVTQENSLIVSPINNSHHNNARGNHGQAGTRGKKEYCSYWIRHGECDYQQQGCLFKHEMPVEVAQLESLGLRDIPRWYREKYGVPSLLRSGRGHHHHALQAGNAGTPKFRAITYYPSDNNMNGSYNDLTPTSNTSSNMQGSRNGNARKPYRSGAAGKRYNDAHAGVGYDRNSGKVAQQFATAPTQPAPTQVDVGSPAVDVGSPAPSSESFVLDIDAEINKMNTPSVQEPPTLGWTNPSISSLPGGVSISDARTVSLTGSMMSAPSPMSVPPLTSTPPLMSAPRVHALGRIVDSNQMGHGVSFNTRLPPPIEGLVNPLSVPGPASFRAQSRRFLELGYDGNDSKNGDQSKNEVSNETSQVVVYDQEVPLIYDGGAALTPSSGTHMILTNMGYMLAQLNADSHPITAWDVLFDFGPIGQDVIYPSMIDAMAAGQALQVVYAEVDPLAGYQYELGPAPGPVLVPVADSDLFHAPGSGFDSGFESGHESGPDNRLALTYVPPTVPPTEEDPFAEVNEMAGMDRYELTWDEIVNVPGRS